MFYFILKGKDCGGCGMENRPNVYKACTENGEEIHKIPYQCPCSRYEIKEIQQTRVYYSWGRRRRVTSTVKMYVF